MTETPFRAGRWIAATLAVLGLGLVFYHLVMDNMPKGEVRKVEDYTPWEPETLVAAETLAVQDGGRITAFPQRERELQTHGSIGVGDERKGGALHRRVGI